MNTLLITLSLLACSDKGTNPDDTSPSNETAADDSGGGDDDGGADSGPAPDSCADPDPTYSGAPALSLTGGTPRNLLVISIDTVRVNQLGRYGGTGATPTLDGMMSEGLVLDSHRTNAAWTYAGMLSGLAGAYNAEIGFIPSVYPDPPARLPDGIPLMADWLVEEGFTGALSTANGYISSDYNTASGYALEYKNPFPAEVMVDEALNLFDQLLTQTGGDRWFLHVHLLDPHSSYNPPEAYKAAYEALDYPFDLTTDFGVIEMSGAYPSMSEEEQAQALLALETIYQAELKYTDDQVARLLDEVDARGALDDTLVVVWSDHGEQFMEHGQIGHGVSLHYGETTGLAFFWMKGGGIAPVAWDDPTDQRDIVPTLFQALDLPTRDEWSGKVVGEASADRARFAARLHADESSQSVIPASRSTSTTPTTTITPASGRPLSRRRR
jgi:arylsulfatase A-like enzyme